MSKTNITVSVADMQSLLPSSFESSGHVFLAPRWPPSLLISLFLYLLVKGKFLLSLSSVFFLQGILQTSAPFWQQHPVFAELPLAHAGHFPRIWWVWVCKQHCNICHRCRNADGVIYLFFYVSGDQGLIHNLILDSRIIGQLASRVWKNKDLNSWVSLFVAFHTVHHCKNLPLCKWTALMASQLKQSWLSKFNKK